MTNQITGFSCRKHFEGYPCCHRQWKHSGHCSLVHGYSRSFTFWFKAKELDQHGFVVDFSRLTLLDEKLKEQFDHTFLVNRDDPLIPCWEKLHAEKALDLRIMENVGMESTAKLVWEWANNILLVSHSGRTCCSRAKASENNFNSGYFESIPDWFNFIEDNPL